MQARCGLVVVTEPHAWFEKIGSTSGCKRDKALIEMAHSRPANLDRADAQHNPSRLTVRATITGLFQVILRSQGF